MNVEEREHQKKQQPEQIQSENDGGRIRITPKHPAQSEKLSKTRREYIEVDFDPTSQFDPEHFHSLMLKRAELNVEDVPFLGRSKSHFTIHDVLGGWILTKVTWDCKRKPLNTKTRPRKTRIEVYEARAT